jgi:hypothetical protein
MPPDNGWESKLAKHKNEYGKKLDIITEFWKYSDVKIAICFWLTISASLSFRKLVSEIYE